MAAPAGFDTWEAAAAVGTGITAGSTILSLALPVGTVVAGFDLDVAQLDVAAVPAITLDVGDAVDPARYVAAADVAQYGGLLEYRPDPVAWFRYGPTSSVPAEVRVTVGTPPATPRAGSIAMTLYGYAGVDVSRLVRQTLQNLAVLAEGETPRAEDAAMALEALNEVHETLRGKHLAARQDLAWPLAAVPIFAARPYGHMAGNLLADVFNLSAARAQRMAARAEEGRKELCRQCRKPTNGEPLSFTPYRDDEPFPLDYGNLL